MALAARRTSAAEALAERDRAAAAFKSETDACEAGRREIEGLEGDVEAARSEVFSAINAATALRHSLEHAAVARDKVGETLSKLQVETDDVRIETERVEADRRLAAEGLRQAGSAIEATRTARAAREAELATSRIEHEWRAKSVRVREHEIAGLAARLKSLEELEASRAGYGDAARAILAQANGKVNQRGAVADYLEVEAGYERAVEACLGDLLQHVIVDRPEHAAAGLQLVREQGVGRCSFLIASAVSPAEAGHYRDHSVTPSSVVPGFSQTVPDGLVAISSIVRVSGPFAAAIQQVMGDAWIAQDYGRAAEVSRASASAAPAASPNAVATLAGDLFRGPHLVSGGIRDESRGILETKREIKDLQQRIETERDGLFRLAEEAAGLEAGIAQATNAILALNAELHKQEKVIVALEAQMGRATEEGARVTQKGEQLARERRQSEEERDTLDRRQAEARASIVQLEEAQRLADEQLTQAQRRLLEAREAAEALGRRAAEAGASHAALVERAAALTVETARLEEASAELEARASALASELQEVQARLESLRHGIVDGDARLDADVRALETLRSDVQGADGSVAQLRARMDEQESAIRTARHVLEEIRAGVAELAVAHATAESDLSHLSGTCIDTVQATLDEVLAEVAALERPAIISFRTRASFVPRSPRTRTMARRPWARASRRTPWRSSAS